MSILRNVYGNVFRATDKKRTQERRNCKCRVVNNERVCESATCRGNDLHVHTYAGTKNTAESLMFLIVC